MSRVGEKLIHYSDSVKVEIKGSHVSVKGPKGTLERHFHPDITIEQGDGEVTIRRPSESKLHRSLHGTSRALLANMVHGVTEGFSKELQVVGIGYTANLDGNRLKLIIGYSHDIYFLPPAEIQITAHRNTIKITGIDKQLVGQVAAKIRSFRPPEPYKGKGIRYIDEYVKIKKGKTVGGTTGV